MFLEHSQAILSKLFQNLRKKRMLLIEIPRVIFFRTVLIKAMTPVVFFSRVRTHAYNTRYLSSVSKSFTSTSHRWSALYIKLSKFPLTVVDKDEKTDDKQLKEFISYGDTVQLISLNTKLSLPDLVFIYNNRSYIKLKVIVS